MHLVFTNILLEVLPFIEIDSGLARSSFYHLIVIELAVLVSATHQFPLFRCKIIHAIIMYKFDKNHPSLGVVFQDNLSKR